MQPRPRSTLLAKELPGVPVQVPADAVSTFGKVARLHFVAKFDDIAKPIAPVISDVEANKVAVKTKTVLEQISPQVQPLLG